MMKQVETDKKCGFCGVINPSDSKYCRGCGVQFIEAKEREKFEDSVSNFVFYDRWKKPYTGFVLRIVLVLFLSMIISVIVGIILDICSSLYDDEATIIAILAFLICMVTGVIFAKKLMPKKKEKKTFSKACEMVEKYTYLGIAHSRRRPKYCIYAKGTLLGLLDVCNYKVVLPAKFEGLRWHKKQKLLIAMKGDNKCIIDIKGRICHE